MDRGLNRQLLELSQRFEPRVPGALTNPVQALHFLNELSDLTHANLAARKMPPASSQQEPATTSQQIPPAQSTAQTQSAPMETPSRTYGSANREYQPALHNLDVVNALLDLHKTRTEVDRKTRHAVPQKTGPASAGTAPAHQKYFFKKSWGASQPILSPRRTQEK